MLHEERETNKQHNFDVMNEVLHTFPDCDLIQHFAIEIDESNWGSSQLFQNWESRFYEKKTENNDACRLSDINNWIWMLLADTESLEPLLPSLVSEDEGAAVALMIVSLFSQNDIVSCK